MEGHGRGHYAEAGIMGYTVTVDACQPALKNALVDLLKARPGILNLDKRFEMVYKVRIHLDGPYIWTSLEFKSQEHFVEWYMRWV